MKSILNFKSSIDRFYIVVMLILLSTMFMINGCSNGEEMKIAIPNTSSHSAYANSFIPITDTKLIKPYQDENEILNGERGLYKFIDSTIKGSAIITPQSKNTFFLGDFKLDKFRISVSQPIVSRTSVFKARFYAVYTDPSSGLETEFNIVPYLKSSSGINTSFVILTGVKLGSMKNMVFPEMKYYLEMSALETIVVQSALHPYNDTLDIIENRLSFKNTLDDIIREHDSIDIRDYSENDYRKNDLIPGGFYYKRPDNGSKIFVNYPKAYNGSGRFRTNIFLELDNKRRLFYSLHSNYNDELDESLFINSAYVGIQALSSPSSDQRYEYLFNIFQEGKGVVIDATHFRDYISDNKPRLYDSIEKNYNGMNLTIAESDEVITRFTIRNDDIEYFVYDQNFKDLESVYGPEDQLDPEYNHQINKIELVKSYAYRNKLMFTTYFDIRFNLLRRPLVE